MLSGTRGVDQTETECSTCVGIGHRINPQACEPDRAKYHPSASASWTASSMTLFGCLGQPLVHATASLQL